MVDTQDAGEEPAWLLRPTGISRNLWTNLSCPRGFTSLTVPLSGLPWVSPLLPCPGSATHAYISILTGIQYKGKALVGDVVDDIPQADQGWLQEQGHIEVTAEKKAARRLPLPLSPARKVKADGIPSQ